MTRPCERGNASDELRALDRDGLLVESAEDLYENAPAAYFSSLPDGTLARVNDTLLRWTGYTRDELVGEKRFHDLLAPGARIYYETHYAPLLQMQGTVTEVAVELVGADGRRLPVLMSSTLVRDVNGTPRLARTTAFDASDRRRYEQELLRARESAELRARASLAVENIAEGVLLVSEDGEIELMNAAAEGIFGVAPATAVGRQADEALAGWREAAARIGAAAEVVPLVRGGAEQWLEISAADAGSSTVYTIREVTADRALEQLRSDVIAIVSHELRTPLTGAYGAAQTLFARYDDLDDATRRELLAQIVEQSARLAKLLDQILMTSRIDTGNLHTSLETFDAHGVVESVARAVDLEARHRLQLDVEGGVMLHADLDRLRQVVANLVDNALKYSDGPVGIVVRKREFFARITVSDDGPGIPASERDRIFDKFFRLDPAQRGGVGGTGLGLYIARELVSRMGGRIGMLPQEQGSAFFVDVPRVP